MLLDIPGVRVVSDSIWISPSIHLRRKLTVLGPTLGGGTHISSVLGANTKMVFNGCLAHYGVNRTFGGSAAWMIYL